MARLRVSEWRAYTQGRLFQQVLEGDEGVKVSVCCHDRREMAIIDESSANRDAIWARKSVDFCIHFRDDFASNFLASLYFDNADGASGLDEQINLASFATTGKFSKVIASIDM